MLWGMLPLRPAPLAWLPSSRSEWLVSTMGAAGPAVTICVERFTGSFEEMTINHRS